MFHLGLVALLSISLCSAAVSVPIRPHGEAKNGSTAALRAAHTTISADEPEGEVEVGEQTEEELPYGCAAPNMFKIDNRSLVYSNLNGHGPHLGYPKAYYLDNIFPESDRVVDMVIKVVAGTKYYADNTTNNRVQGGFAQINVASGTTLRLEVSFIDSHDGSPVKVPDFYLTFFGLGQEGDNSGVERVSVSGAKSYQLTETTKCTAVETEDGYVFQSTAKSSSLILPTGGSSLAPTSGNHTLNSTQTSSPDMVVSPLSVSDDVLDASVSLMVGGVSKIMVDLSVTAGWESHNFVIAGGSNMVCPSQYLCSSMACPAFYEAKDGAEFETCIGMPCSLQDVSTCCVEKYPEDCEPSYSMMFSPDSVVWSNLGGLGPDFQSPQSILYYNVFPKSGTRVDLNVSVIGSYITEDPPKNGQYGDFGEINLAPGEKADLLFSFVSTDGRPMVLKHEWFFSVFDFDMQKDGGGKEAVAINGFLWYNLSNDTKVAVGQDAMNRTTFTATEFGNSDDNPADPKNMSADTLAKTVTFTFPPIDHFEVSFSTTPGTHGRNFMFTGSSAIPCPSQVTCDTAVCPDLYVFKEKYEDILCMESPCNMDATDLHRCCELARKPATCETYECPEFHELRPQASHLECAGEECGEADVSVCCTRRMDVCDAKRVMDIGEHNLKYSNLGGRGPHFQHPHEILFIDVFEGMPGIDLRIRNMSEYRALSFQSNGAKGAFAAINLQKHASVDLQFDLMNHETRKVLKPSELDTNFLFTVADIETIEKHSHKEVTWLGGNYTNMFMAEHSTWATNPHDQHNFRGTAELHASSAHTLHPFALSGDQKEASMSFVVTEPSWTLSFATTHGGEGGTLYFAGASNVACESRETCMSATCPAPFMLKDDASSILCTDSKCSEQDEATCCGCSAQNTLWFTEHSLKYSNLGGHGPDADEPEGMYFENVFPDHGGEPVDLEIKSLEYVGSNVSHNLVNGEFGQINIKTGSMARLEFRFYQKGEKKRVEPFFFSVFDLDEQHDGGGKETVSVSKYSDYTLSSRSEVGFYEGEFRSLMYGTERDNPAHPLALTAEHMNHSITFSMPALPSFELNFTVSPGWFGRNFLFGGPSNLVCDTRALCASHTCSSGLKLKKAAEHLVCSGKTCTRTDDKRCCFDAEKAHLKHVKASEEKRSSPESDSGSE